MKNNNLQTKIFVRNIKQINVFKYSKNINPKNILGITGDPVLSFCAFACSNFFNLTRIGKLH